MIVPQTELAAASISTDVAISIRSVSKTYPVPLLRLKQLLRPRTAAPAEALHDVSFDVRQGEIFGLIGRNGAGKTTLTKIIATLVRPTRGSVEVANFDSVRDEVRVRAAVGLAAAEERSFYWRLTAIENLSFFARLYGLSSAETRTRSRELLEQFELTEIARRRFGELSTGNKQRLAVARAMLARPPVLLLDEPTRSLDPLAAARMRALISSLAAGDRDNQKVTVLLTSHNLAEIEELCPRVGIISRGRLRALDTPANLRRKHPQAEQLRLRVSNIDECALNLLRVELPDADFQILPDAATPNTILIRFTRRADDDKLDHALRTLHAHNACVISCDTERATLLDVLEACEVDINDNREAVS